MCLMYLTTDLHYLYFKYLNITAYKHTHIHDPSQATTTDLYLQDIIHWC